MSSFLYCVVSQEDNRQLQFRLTRSGGSSEDISIIYRVLYLPQGTNDPNLGMAGTIAVEFNTVVMSATDVEKTVTLNIYNNAFLAQGDQLYVELNNTELNAAGLRMTTFACTRVCVCVCMM